MNVKPVFMFQTAELGQTVGKAEFQECEQTPHKRWKLTKEDWRNHEKLDAYISAAHQMIQHTSTSQSPWTLVECNDKYYGRIKILDTICAALEEAV